MTAFVIISANSPVNLQVLDDPDQTNCSRILNAKFWRVPLYRFWGIFSMLLSGPSSNEWQ